MMKKLPLLFLITFLSLNCLLLNAQTNGTFTNASGDGLWSTEANWDTGSLPGTTDQVTLNTSVDLGGSSYTVAEIIIDGTTVTISNGTLILKGTTASSTNPNAIGNANNGNTIFDCNVTFDTDKRIRNPNSGTLTFAAGTTLTFGSYDINLNNLSTTNPIVFNGALIGTGIIGLKGKIISGSSSDFTGFTGTFSFMQSNNALLVVEGENTLNGSAITSTTTGTAEVLFNANQTNISNLSVTSSLALNFGSAVTSVQFVAGAITGVVDLKNYTSGELKIGTTNLIVPQATLNTWFIGGIEPVDGTITQDFSGYIIIPEYTSITGTGINWEDSSSWLGNIAPTAATDNVYIQGSLIINSDVSVNNFTILTGGLVTENVTVTPGNSLTVNGNAATNNNLFAESNATSFSSLIFNSTVTGEVGYHRWVHTTPTNDLISAPVPETFGAIADDLFPNPSDTTQKLFGPFNNESGVYENWDTTTYGSNDLIAGKGYRAAKAGADGTILFQGEPVSPVDNVSINLTNGT
ncbi:MAG: hypothetical protein ABJ218_07260, partial [Winogradskyella arenosi]